MKPEKKILIACTGSVASIKLLELVQSLQNQNLPFTFVIKVILTDYAKHFVQISEIQSECVQVLQNQDEWISWQKRGDPVLHIDLGKWADLMVIAPLSANSLAKIAVGICDNLLLCVVRAWDFQKPILFCPAMNTRMYDHPITCEQITKIKQWGFHEIPCISKTLMCGDTGNGAMAEVNTIIDNIVKKCYF